MHERAEIISAIGAVLSAVATVVSILVAWLVWRGQRLLSQRQLLLPLWTYMSGLNAIDPLKPVTPEVLKVLNTLELVALCCEGGMVDRRVIKRTFRAVFVSLYQQVNQCAKVPGLNKSGPELLTENPAAMAFYAELMAEHLNRDRLQS